MGVHLSRLCVSWLSSWPFPNFFVGHAVNVAAVLYQSIKSKVLKCRTAARGAELTYNCEYRSPFSQIYLETSKIFQHRSLWTAPRHCYSQAACLCARARLRTFACVWVQMGEKHRVMSLDRKIIFSLQSSPAAILEPNLTKLKLYVLWV